MSLRESICKRRQTQGKGIVKKKCESSLSCLYLMVSEGPKQFLVSPTPVNLKTFSAREIFILLNFFSVSSLTC